MKPPADTSWIEMDQTRTGSPSNRSGWVRRAPEPRERHTCQPPMQEIRYEIPPTPEQANQPPRELRITRPDGQRGDLWRCACGHLWSIHRPPPVPPGMRAGEDEWQPATIWQRIRYRKYRKYGWPPRCDDCQRGMHRACDWNGDEPPCHCHCVASIGTRIRNRPTKEDGTHAA